jgi:uncharacterized membrane protein
MSYAAADLHLAIAHHLLIFVLAGILAFEIGVIHLNITRHDINRVGRIDAWYGISMLVRMSSRPRSPLNPKTGHLKA